MAEIVVLMPSRENHPRNHRGKARNTVVCLSGTVPARRSSSRGTVLTSRFLLERINELLDQTVALLGKSKA
jgi:hypothetical protein